MKGGTIFASRADVDELMEDESDDLFGWVPGHVDMTAEDVGTARLVVSEWTSKLHDSHYVADVLDMRDEEWYDSKFAAKIFHYENGEKKKPWVPIAIIEEEVDEEIQERVDEFVDEMVGSGVSEKVLAALLTEKVDEIH